MKQQYSITTHLTPILFLRKIQFSGVTKRLRHMAFLIICCFFPVVIAYYVAGIPSEILPYHILICYHRNQPKSVTIQKTFLVMNPYYLLNLGLVASVLRPEAELWGVWYHFGFIYWRRSIIFGFYLCGCSLIKKLLCWKFWIPGNAGWVPLVYIIKYIKFGSLHICLYYNGLQNPVPGLSLQVRVSVPTVLVRGWNVFWRH